MTKNLTQHRSHDYGFLVKQWKSLASRAGLMLRRFAKSGEHSIFLITSPSQNWKPRTGNREPCFYISAGVHGDEPAPPWALLEWASENVELLLVKPFIIFPCLNPHGLINNTRIDHRGVDINRTFHDGSEKLMGEWRRLISQQPISLGLCLHEDFDAQGVYVYELNQSEDIVGHRILSDCADVMPVDARAKIDGRKADRGLINRRRVPLDLPGMPEAIELFRMGVPVSLTFESPSEFSLVERIAVQKKFIESSLRHVAGI